MVNIFFFKLNINKKKKVKVFFKKLNLKKKKSQVSGGGPGRPPQKANGFWLMEVVHPP